MSSGAAAPAQITVHNTQCQTEPAGQQPHQHDANGTHRVAFTVCHSIKKHEQHANCNNTMSNMCLNHVSAECTRIQYLTDCHTQHGRPVV